VGLGNELTPPLAAALGIGVIPVNIIESALMPPGRDDAWLRGTLPIRLAEMLALAVSTAARAERFACDFLRCSRCGAAKKSNCNRERGASHCHRSYYFAIAVWRAKDAEFAV